MESEKVKEIKKGLECCTNPVYCEKECPYHIYERHLECINELAKDSLTLINELESENERLENKNYQLEQDLGQCENGYKLEFHTARYQLHSANEDLQKAKDRIAELEKEKKDYYDRINNLQAYIDNHEEIWERNTEIQLKQFAEKVAKRLINIKGIKEILHETLKEFIK